MNKLKILLPAFIILALVQLFVPAKMIWDKEQVMKTGKEFKFKTIPVDPNDPFRGKYIALRYEGNTLEVEKEDEWMVGDQIYVSLTTDSLGFAKIQTVSRDMPQDSQDYLTSSVTRLTGLSTIVMTVDYPFNRFYMKETKAYEAEQVYRAAQQDSSRTAYALVSILQGDAVLKDVLINGIPLKNMVEEE